MSNFRLSKFLTKIKNSTPKNVTEIIIIRIVLAM